MFIIPLDATSGAEMCIGAGLELNCGPPGAEFDIPA